MLLPLPRAQRSRSGWALTFPRQPLTDDLQVQEGKYSSLLPRWGQLSGGTQVVATPPHPHTGRSPSYSPGLCWISHPSRSSFLFLIFISLCFLGALPNNLLSDKSLFRIYLWLTPPHHHHPHTHMLKIEREEKRGSDGSWSSCCYKR